MIKGILDFHVHTAPSLMPRRYEDGEILAVAKQAGVETVVLKAHEGSTVERARRMGEGAVGGIVLNSPVGGANPDAVDVAAALGGRIVWMPTVSAPAHVGARETEELAVHRALRFSTVLVADEDRLRHEWVSVFDTVADHDLILASGHLSMDEAVVAFREASARGVKRLLVNHPKLPFLEWREEHGDAFQQLGARIEIGVVADRLSPGEPSPTEYFLSRYPRDLLVFGSDLGHTAFPGYVDGLREWTEQAERIAGLADLERILVGNGKELLKT